MARFRAQKLPPHWMFVPSKRQVRDLIDRTKGDVRVVEFGRTSPGRRDGYVSLGFLESRAINGKWIFFLRIWGVREGALGTHRDELAQAAVAEIEGYIRQSLLRRPDVTVKPELLHLSFMIESEGIRSTCRKRIKDRYSFYTGDWWINPENSAEHGAQP